MNNLETLLESFSPAEKTYCRRYLFKNVHKGKDPVLKTMFSMLSANEEEKKIKEKIYGKEGRFSLKNENAFRVHKNKLMKVLLDALSDFEGEKSVDSKIHTIIQRGIVLRNKGLGGSAEKYFEKGVALALTAERYDLAESCLFNLLNLSQKNFIDAPAKKKRDAWRKQMRICRKMQANIQLFSGIMDKISLIQTEVNNFKYTKKDQLKKIKKTVPFELFNDENSALCFESKCIFYLCRSKIANATADYSSFQFYTRKVLVLMESQPEKIPYYESKYRFALNQYLNSSLHHSDFSDFDHFLFQLEQSGRGLKSANMVRHWLMIVNLKMNRNFKEEKTEMNLPLIRSSEKLLPVYEKILGPGFFTALYANFIISFLYCGQFRAGLKFINKLLNNATEKTKDPILIMIKISNLIVHYELKNEKLLISLLRHYEKTDPSIPFAKILLTFCLSFGKLSRGGKNQAEIFAELAENISELAGDTAMRALIEDFYLEKWLQEKVAR
ncbi:MAG: hypothetical protein IAF38_10100 [Bacteroidia bacterium]|nr:hypothetical protein [Bacteroidia bacterium]